MMRAMPIDGNRRDADQRPCSVGPCHKHVAPLSRFHGQQNPHSRLPGPYPLDKEFNWRTVTPIAAFGGNRAGEEYRKGADVAEIPSAK